MMLTPCNCNNYMTSSRTVEGGKKDGMLSELCITAYSSFQLSKLTDIIVTQEKRNMDAVTVGVVITARAYRLGGIRVHREPKPAIARGETAVVTGSPGGSPPLRWTAPVTNPCKQPERTMARAPGRTPASSLASVVTNPCQRPERTA